MKSIAVILSLSFVFAYLPTDAERARWTMNDFRSIATAAEAYKTDYNGYPQASSMEELQKLVQPLYIKSLPMHDAWGTPYRYISDGKTMTIVSAGADQKFNEASWKTPAKWMAAFDEDAVWSNDSFVRNWDYK